MDADFRYIAIGLMAFGMMGAALAIGMIFKGGAEGIARNPSAEQNIAKYLFVGAALAEAMGLFALVIAFLILFM